MPVGIHSFYAYSIADTHRIGDKDSYFIGRFIGDDFADEEFVRKKQKITTLLRNKYGQAFCHYWFPVQEKPYKPRTTEQKLATSMKKAANKNVKKVQEIRSANYLFQEVFIAEEEAKLSKRIIVLKERYKD